jgi:hypothetical protein
VKSIKLFGLAAMAALALTAVLGVASASALDIAGNTKTGKTFYSHIYPAKVSGNQLAVGASGYQEITPKSLVLGMAAGQLKCTTNTLSDPPFASEGISGPTEMLWLKPTLSGCALSGLKVAVTQDAECLETFNVGGGYEGYLDLCGLTLEVTETGAAKCKITIPSQMRPGMTFENGSWNREGNVFLYSGVIAKANLSGLTYNIESPLCPNKASATEGVHTDGTYKGTIGLS